MSSLTERSPLLLGSRSPRRLELLRSAEIPVRAEGIDANEDVRVGEAWRGYIERIVADKLRLARALVEPNHVDVPAVLVADTVVVLDGEVFGKPGSVEQAAAMIRALSGRTHEVSTRFALWHRERDVSFATTITTRVTVRELSSRAVLAYASSREGLDKAGGYAIQGGFAYAIKHIDGSYSNVVGLPLADVVLALESFDLWPR